MVCPSTKCEPISRMAWRVAVRSVGKPTRRTMVSRIVSDVSPGWMMRAATPSVHADAETRSAVDLSSPSSQRPAASLSSIRRSAVAASGTRNNASASTMSARPSLVESE